MVMENPTIKEEELLSYVIASGDMRFIGIGERVLYLRSDPELGQVIRGEMPGCGSDCYVNFSQTLLEYVMSCGDCRQAELAAKAADHFGEQLGQKLRTVCFEDTAVSPKLENLTNVLTLILNSMDVPFQLDQSENQLQFTLAYCPLHTTAHKTGLNLWVALAHRALISLVETLLQDLAPKWTLQTPAERESEKPIQEILFVRK